MMVKQTLEGGRRNGELFVFNQLYFAPEGRKNGADMIQKLT